MMLVGLLAVIPAMEVGAIKVFEGCKGTAGSKSVVCDSVDADKNTNSAVQNIINLLLYVLGIMAVIVIIIGGLRYVISGGDASATKAAKDMILFAVVGLIVAVLAWSIVNFVVERFK